MPPRFTFGAGTVLPGLPPEPTQRRTATLKQVSKIIVLLDTFLYARPVALICLALWPAFRRGAARPAFLLAPLAA